MNENKQSDSHKNGNPEIDGKQGAKYSYILSFFVQANLNYKLNRVVPCHERIDKSTIKNLKIYTLTVSSSFVSSMDAVFGVFFSFFFSKSEMGIQIQFWNSTISESKHGHADPPQMKTNNHQTIIAIHLNWHDIATCHIEINEFKCCG